MPKREAQQVEYKSSWQEEYFEWIAGYANANGGSLYIGVNDDGYVVGIADAKFLLDTLPNQVNSYLGITVSIDHKSAKGLGHNLKFAASDSEDEASQEDIRIPSGVAEKPVNLYARGLLTEAVLDEIDADPGNTTQVSAALQLLYEAAPGFVKQLRGSKEKREQTRSKIVSLQTNNPLRMNPDGTLEYVLIKVKEYSHGVPYHGRYYKRSGGTTHELTGTELSQFLYDKVGQKWDAVLVKDIELRHDAFDFMRDHAVEKGRLTPKASSVSDEVLYRNLQMTTKKTSSGEYPRAAAMLFGEPEDVVVGSYIRIGYFDRIMQAGQNMAGQTPSYHLKFQEEVHGSLVSQAERAVDMIFEKFLKALVDINGLYRTETYMTTRELLREVILNAVAHKYYQSCAPIQIKVYDDHITVVNEGLWPFGELAVEDVYVGEHSSYQTNPLIAKGLFMAGVMDTWGQGFDLIKGECEKINAPLPEVSATERYVTVTVRACAKYMELLDVGHGLAHDAAQDTAHVRAHDKAQDAARVENDDVLSARDKLLNFCEEMRTRQEMMDHISYSSRRHFAELYLRPLLSEGLLRMTIPDKPKSKNQKYIRTKSEMERAQAMLENNPVLGMSPGDLRESGQSVEEYLEKYTLDEQKLYREYYGNEI